MGSTNFLQFNPTQSNMENDAAYTTDPTRTGGAGVDAIWPSPSANKSLYQITTFVAALAQALANKGYVLSDANIATLTAVLANVLTTADVRANLQFLAYAPTLSCNVNLYLGFQVNLIGNLALTIPGVRAGDRVAFIFTQDATGGRTVAWPANVDVGLQPDAAPNSTSVIVLEATNDTNLHLAGPATSDTGINATPVGVGTPSTGNFTMLKLNGAGPANQVLTGNGTSFVPTIAPGFTSGTGAGGYWEKNPNGRIENWINSVALGGGDYAWTFPTPFTSVVSVNVQAIAVYPSGDTGYLTVVEGSVTTTGCTIHQNDLTSMLGDLRATGY